MKKISTNINYVFFLVPCQLVEFLSQHQLKSRQKISNTKYN